MDAQKTGALIAHARLDGGGGEAPGSGGGALPPPAAEGLVSGCP
ncbi:hypothetical protein [Pseudoflavonifractor sp. An184]|nr:hypothetical protein [Pseudoflavonifractor sp. An184]